MSDITKDMIVGKEISEQLRLGKPKPLKDANITVPTEWLVGEHTIRVRFNNTPKIVAIVFKDGNPITIKFGEMQGKENKQ